MAGYLINFSIYTTAMIGVIFIALFTFKKVAGGCFSKKSSMLSIEDSIKLSTRKTLHIIKAQNEKFLIASDIDRTVLISKLESPQEFKKQLREDKSAKLTSFDGVTSLQEFASIIDLNKKRENKKPVMKELAKKLSNI